MKKMGRSANTTWVVFFALNFGNDIVRAATDTSTASAIEDSAIVALLFLLVLAALGAALVWGRSRLGFLSRHFSAQQAEEPRRLVSRIDRQRLDMSTSLYVVEFGGERLLIAKTGDSVVFLTKQIVGHQAEQP